MRTAIMSAAFCLIVAGCTSLQDGGEAADPHAAGMTAAGEQYLTCLNREAEKNMKNPAGAEDIAAAAHGQCWNLWQRYRRTTTTTFLRDAQTPEERQLAEDKADAHLRQFELQARRGVVGTIAERNVKAAPGPSLK